jgi:hypothetical protein
VTPREEVLSLADAVIEGSITEPEIERLSALLLGDAEAQRTYLRALDLEASLEREMRGGVAGRPARASTDRRSVRSIAAAAAILVACAAGLLMLRSAPTPPAILLRSHAARWGGGRAAIEAGRPLEAGVYRLEGGHAELLFSNGVKALVEGPSEFVLISPLRLELASGQIVCRAPHGVIGFVVDTSKAEIRDLGTEFGVRVGEGGRTEVQVYEGEVMTRLKSGPEPERRLLGGQALDVQASATELLFRPSRFTRTLPGPGDPGGRGMHPYNLARYDEIHVMRAARAPAVDGDLSDWNLSGRIATACEPPYQSYGLEAAMMYDDRFLYVGGHVRDPFPMRSRISPEIPREVYGMGGCVALRVSTDRRMGWPVHGQHADVRRGRPAAPEDESDRLCFITLWYYQPARQACLHLRYGMDLHGTTVNPPGYRGAFKPDADGQGYTFEYALPWELLHASADPPREGDTLGAMWLAHWSDAQGQTWQGQLIDVANPRERGWNFYNAGTWGRAIYHGVGPLAPGTLHSLPDPAPRGDE